MKNRSILAIAASFFFLLLHVLPAPVLADNCSGLSDCFRGNMLPAILLILGLLVLIGLLWYFGGLAGLGLALRGLIGAAGRSRVIGGLAAGLGAALRRLFGKWRSPPKIPTKPPPKPPQPPPKPPINRQKQDGHVKDTPQNKNRVKQDKPTSTFNDSKNADQLTQEAWEKGTPVPGRPNVREHDFGKPVGTGPNGGQQTRVRVHQDGKGQIHGHPSGPEIP